MKCRGAFLFARFVENFVKIMVDKIDTRVYNENRHRCRKGERHGNKG